MRILLSTLALIGCVSFAQAADPLPADKAFALSASHENGKIAFKWDIASGYYLYKDHISVKENNISLPIQASPGIEKNDPNFGLTEIYYGNANISVTPNQTGDIILKYQGCQEDGICYPVETRSIDPITLSISEVKVKHSFENFSYRKTEKPVVLESDVKPVNSNIQVSNEKGLVESLLDEGNEAFVIFSFLIFGLLLALTPCVFPMYPIMASALAREGEKLTPWRGFVLSSIYVASLATAFALIGAIAGYSGQNLQLLLQSPYTVGVIAAIFGVLALSMFGLFELQLPSKWTNSIQSGTSKVRGGKRSAAILGFSSALIIGPCVTAPLAGALLFIAQSANIALGAAALFALGIGKGIPLIIMSTIGSSIMPKAGAWMENIKRIFGFAFIGSAIWMATPLLPIGFDLILWAILFMCFAAFLISENWKSINGKMIARGLAATMFVYGSLLIIGFVSGSSNSMRPLDQLVKTTSVSLPSLQFKEVANMSELKNALSNSKENTLVYFTADWCTACHTIAKQVLTDNDVKTALNDIQLIKVVLSNVSDEKQALMKDLNVVGPPTMLFFENDKEISGSRLVGDITADKIIDAIKK